jgi:hypothetical protein
MDVTRHSLDPGTPFDLFLGLTPICQTALRNKLCSTRQEPACGRIQPAIHQSRCPNRISREPRRSSLCATVPPPPARKEARRMIPACFSHEVEATHPGRTAAGWRPRPQGASWGPKAAAEFLVRFSCPTSGGHATRELPVWLQSGHLEVLNRSMKMCRPLAGRIITRPARFIGSSKCLEGGR